MFDNLTNSLSKTLRNISGRGRLTEDNIRDSLREIRLVLLEADVALPVVREFINRVKISAIGQEINKSLTPGQEFIKIVRNELIIAMGVENNTLNLNTQPPAVILIVGLQGVGKTTSVAKLGKFLHEKKKKKVLMVSLDIYRPAAIRQLEKLAEQINIDFYLSDITQKPIEIIKNALQLAKLQFYDILLVDTAGRLHIDELMMNEIEQVHAIINPIETLLVVDAMTGQDSANIATIFNERLSLTGIFLTKVDGDARGGAALSLRYITGKPIKFIGIGEKNEALEIFYPERIASRILGMGDMLSLIEDIENKVDQDKAKKLAKKIKIGENFNFNDFLEQLKQVHNIGGVTNFIKKLPGISHFPDCTKLQTNDKMLVHMEAIINSMTNDERNNPTIIKGSRKRRIAIGSGMKIQDVNRLLKQFDNMHRIMKTMNKNGISKMLRNIKGLLSSQFNRH
ncbi:signal recognition particle protein [Pantoea sp. Mhis]|uniref:signal recognition particle protein n=1 Tax=Pantoea sp. Mhis TaxID=2576759 RepID=UPI0013578DF1|nr:signal recognition particle protein [Pantoea sp. Mhis]MXP56630.1 signal recognition particle protein [Pantoea sp. Mhis]